MTIRHEEPTMRHLFVKTVPGSYRYEHTTGTYYATYNGRKAVELRFYALHDAAGTGELLGTFGSLTAAADAAREHTIYGEVTFGGEPFTYEGDEHEDLYPAGVCRTWDDLNVEIAARNAMLTAEGTA